MSDDTWALILTPLVAIAIGIEWWYMSRLYRQTFGHSVKWWAIPFAHGAVIWNQRLPRNWERP